MVSKCTNVSISECKSMDMFSIFQTLMGDKGVYHMNSRDTKKLSVTLSLKKPLWKSRDGWVGIFKKVLENLPAFKPAVLAPKFSFKAQMYIFNHCCWEAFHNIVFGGVTGMKLSWAVDVPRELSSPSFSQLSKGLSLFDGQLPSKTPFLRADALGAKLC